MDKALSLHQRDQEKVFTWLEFLYKEGNALLEAAKRHLADETSLKPLCSGACYTSSRSSIDRFVWLDADWFIPEASEDRALFLSMSYSSDDRVGVHLLLGMCDLDSNESALINNPTKVGHWIVDYLDNHSSHSEKFHAEKWPNGLIEFLPGDGLKENYVKGLKRIILAPFPVSWIDSEEKLLQIIRSLVVCFDNDNADELGFYCNEALEAVDGKEDD